MKKLLAIIVLGLVLNGNAYADVRGFNKWLYDNGHYDLVEKVEIIIKNRNFSRNISKEARKTILKTYRQQSNYLKLWH